MKKLLLTLVLTCLLFVLPVSANQLTDEEKASAIAVNSTEEAIEVLLKARSAHQENIYLYLNPEIVPYKSEKGEGWADLHSSIYNAFHYGYSGGLYNSMDYSIFAGPSTETHEYQDEEGLYYYNSFTPDFSNPGYGYIHVCFSYSTNAEELIECDTKINSILAGISDYSDKDKVFYIYNWMKDNLPESKISDDGYPRNCNGVYGALFGGGTGYCCATYASTFQRFMELADIPSWIVGGAYMNDEPNHAINVVKISGKWYVFDYTQDAVLIGSNDFSKYYSFEDLTGLYTKDYSFGKTSLQASTNSETEVPTEPTSSEIKKGDTVTKSGNTYKVTGASTVTFLKAKTNAKSITVPSTIKINKKSYKVTQIAPKAFKSCAIQKVTIGKYVTSIGKYAFYKCKKLKTIIFKGASVPQIEKYAFKNIYKKAIIKVPRKSVTAYQTAFTSKTGFKKTMTIRKK